MIKNGLSGLLMASIWRDCVAPQPFLYWFDEDERHVADVEAVLRRIPEAVRITDVSQVRASDALFHTTSYLPVSRKFIAEAPCVRRTLIEHGTIEVQRFIAASISGQTFATSVYRSLFHKELTRHFRITGCAPAAALRPLPMDALRDFAGGGSAPVRTGTGALFLAQPLLERQAISEASLRKAVSGFLDRRAPTFYRIKDHPQHSPESIRVLVEELAARGLDWERLPASTEAVELSLAKLKFAEITTFYSTGVLTCAKIFGSAYDTMVPELSSPDSGLIESQAVLVAFLDRFFGEAIRSAGSA